MFGSSGFSAFSFSQSGGVDPDVSVSVAGVSAICAVPNPIEEHGGAFAENSFAEAPFASEKSEPFFITVNTVANVSVTGLEATGQSNGVVFNETVNLTGLEATASVGDATANVSTPVEVTGLQATMPVIAIDSGGSLFGGISFGEEPFAELGDTGLKIIIREGTGVPVTGVEGTGAVGSVSIDLAPNISVTGVAGTGGVGSVTITEGAGVNVAVTGISATGGVGSASVVGDANVSVTGLEATGTPGSVTVIEGSGVAVATSSPRLQGQVGIVAPNAQITVPVTGVSATGQVADIASVVSWNQVVVNQDPNWVEIAA